jgi:hypothetical protein
MQIKMPNMDTKFRASSIWNLELRISNFNIGGVGAGAPAREAHCTLHIPHSILHIALATGTGHWHWHWHWHSAHGNDNIKMQIKISKSK